MDYESMAEELLGIRAELLRVPANRMINEFARGELFVLNYLMAHSGTIFPKDLSKVMKVSSARIAALLNQMEKKGWIVRTTDMNDCRQTIIALTDDGKKEVEKARKEIVQAGAQMLEKIGPEDAKELLRIERKILKM